MGFGGDLHGASREIGNSDLFLALLTMGRGYHVHFGKRIRGSEFLAKEIKCPGSQINRKLAIFLHSRRSIHANRNPRTGLSLDEPEIANNKCQ